MASEFPRSPRILKGALVAYQLPDLLPTIIVFQYNPEEMSRNLQGRVSAGGGRGDANRTNGPPSESISLSVEIDATDQLENPGENGIVVDNGLHPVIAALEGLMYPSYPVVIANQVLALAGSAMILGEPSPLALLIWGPKRVLPVQVGSVSITEQAFDTNLNPTRAKADLSLKVMTYRDLDVTNPAYWVYMAAFTQKEVLSAMNTIGSVQSIKQILPF